jgi:hypothetical protein
MLDVTDTAKLSRRQPSPTLLSFRAVKGRDPDPDAVTIFWLPADKTRSVSTKARQIAGIIRPSTNLSRRFAKQQRNLRRR